MLISKIRNLRVNYEKKPDNYYCTLDEYILFAKKSIMRFASPVAKSLLKNEDFISDIAYAIMMADWRWDGNGDRVGYRSKCADWAIKVNLNKLKKQNKKNKDILSLNWQINNNRNDSDADLYSIVEDKRLTKSKEIDVKGILENSGLTDLQKQYISMYYMENMNLKQIAEQFNTTPQNINQTITRGIEKIRKFNKKEIYENFK